jgi:hypothetical protein
VKRRLAVILGSAFLLAAAAVMPAAAASRNEGQRMLGVVPPIVHGAKPARPTKTNNLTYHGGPVQHGSRTYSIYWGPANAWDAGYASTINSYFANVAHDSGKTSNVYYSDTQYTDGAGAIAYNVIAGATYMDTAAYPANGCSDRATSICLSDSQLQSEIQRVMTLNGWTAVGSDGIQNEYFVFTPRGVGSCAGSSCAYSTYCAYHSWIGSGAGAILYANMPYAVQNYRIYTCDSGQRPNGVTADATLNLLSHEHNETITDEQGNAWYDSQGNENGDKCAWNFGSVSGASGAQYNQTINGAHYYLQQEWSNRSSGCVLTGV